MNTGKPIETERLRLLPESRERDGDAFTEMLRTDNDFESFYVLPFSEKRLERCKDFFGRSDHDECLFAIYPKDLDVFVGYVGFHSEGEHLYEIEFYIGRKYRRQGYCEEAARAAIRQLFTEGISVDDDCCIETEVVSATTGRDNVAARGVLEKLGFKPAVDDDGQPLFVVVGYTDDEMSGTLTFQDQVLYALTRSDFMAQLSAGTHGTGTFIPYFALLRS